MNIFKRAKAHGLVGQKEGQMIQGVQIKPLKIFRDQRGQVMHMMRCDDGVFNAIW